MRNPEDRGARPVVVPDAPTWPTAEQARANVAALNQSENPDDADLAYGVTRPKATPDGGDLG